MYLESCQTEKSSKRLPKKAKSEEKTSEVKLTIAKYFL